MNDHEMFMCAVTAVAGNPAVGNYVSQEFLLQAARDLRAKVYTAVLCIYCMERLYGIPFIGWRYCGLKSRMPIDC